MRKYACATVIALLATGAGAGCGGDEEEPLSKAEYIKQGDAICEKFGDMIDKEAEEAFADLGPDEEPSEEQLTTFVEDIAKPNVEDQLSELRDLPAPEADEDELNGVYDDVETALAKIEDDPLVILEEGEDPFEEPNDAARAYGFKECGES
ncbi:hypothetical protein BH20ACT19_BH20ACT19_12990 [soil metagenome]